MAIRVRVCFSCKEYIPIHPDNPLSDVNVKAFNNNHNGHPVQTVNRSELDKSYIIWIPKDLPTCIIKKEFW